MEAQARLVWATPVKPHEHPRHLVGPFPCHDLSFSTCTKLNTVKQQTHCEGNQPAARLSKQRKVSISSCLSACCRCFSCQPREVGSSWETQASRAKRGHACLLFELSKFLLIAHPDKNPTSERSEVITKQSDSLVKSWSLWDLIRASWPSLSFCVASICAQQELRFRSSAPEDMRHMNLSQNFGQQCPRLVEGTKNSQNSHTLHHAPSF